MIDNYKTFTFWFDVWNSKNNTLFYLGIGLFVVGLVIRTKKSSSKKIVVRIKRVLIIVGIMSFLCSFTTGLGSGIGIGDGNGFAIGTGSAEDGNDVDDEQVSIEDAAQLAAERNIVTVTVNENDIYINGWLCDESEEIESALDTIYKDGMIVEIEDTYAYYEPYSIVINLLKDRAIDYKVTRYEED
ncbi:MAG: hypothetical protein K6G87_01700 [Butyrivibrio sp.]|uniref:hypothetical protein n=1 Tax=Butyrivibrio sp. TaxID=28121 RepID=UPI0025DF173D|nr:hypothetical protein [Butyrivibrio sp.]MCR5769929.1 hypothetical protein [Butyrivibrio sp.]